MRLTVMSFGFKFGIPEDANLVLDVRCLPNPFYIPELKHKTGLDEEVVDFVMGHPEAKELLRRYEGFLEYALPLYVKGGEKPADHLQWAARAASTARSPLRGKSRNIANNWAIRPAFSTVMRCADPAEPVRTEMRVT